MLEKFKLHDVVQMKKPHACGSSEWQIVRVGADIKIKCLGCGRIVMLDRPEFEKRVKRLITQKAEDQDQ